MIDQAIANGLYLELLFAAMTLLGILLINNLMLYMQKVNGLISLMLISGVVMCVLEIVWTFIDGNPDYKILSYLSAGGYAVSLIIFSAFVNLYLIDRFGIKLKNPTHYLLCAACGNNGSAVRCYPVDTYNVPGGRKRKRTDDGVF